MFSAERPEENAGLPPRLLLCLFLLALWLFGHPLQGLRHDSIYYAIQALFHLHPERYGQDLFFLHGSQSEFTLFPSLYAKFINFFGLQAAMALLLVSGYALWAGGTVFLAGRLLQGFPFWLGLVLIFSIPGYYATDTLFRYGEPFLTPRILSEALTMLALGLLMHGRRLIPFALLLAALALHPLMALAGIVFALFYLFRHTPRAVLAASTLGAILFLLLAFLQIAPFDHLLAGMDSEWLGATFARAPFIFWEGWEATDLNRALFAFSLLLAAALTAQGRVRHAFLAALAVGLTGLLLFWAGTSLTQNLLLIQVQTYRWLWLSQLFSFIAAAWLFGRFRSEDRTCRLLLSGFLLAWLPPDHAGAWLAVPLCLLFLLYTRNGRKFTPPKAITRLIPGLILAGVVWRLLAAWQEASVAFSGGEGTSAIGFALFWGIMFFKAGGGGIVAVPCLLGIWRHGPVQQKVAHLATTGGVLLLLGLSLALWHRPDKWNRLYLPQVMQNPVPAFSRLIPEDASMYWEDDLKMTWFALGRASYASYPQLAGLAFNRQTAMEGTRRMSRLAALGTGDSTVNWHSPDGNHHAGRPPVAFEALVHVCHDPALDFVVLSSRLEQGVIAEHLEEVSGKYFYLYDCSQLRQDFADPREGKETPQ